MRTIEELMLAMDDIVNLAKDRNFTDEEVSKYEALETELASVKRTQEIMNRNNAYKVTHIPAGIPSRSVKPEGDEPKEGFINYLRTGIPNNDITHLNNSLGTGTSAGGGYLVPDSFGAELIRVMADFGGLANIVRTFTTTTGESISFPTNDDTGNVGSIVSENTAPTTGADPTFGNVSIGTYTYRSTGASGSPVRVSTRLIRDSAFDIESELSRQLGERIARAQAAHWVTGNGVGQPLGVAATSLTQDADLDTPDTITYNDLVDLKFLLNTAYRKNGTWVMSSTTWTSVLKILDGNDRPLVQDSTTGIAGAPGPVLLGHPVQLDDDMANLSTSINYPILFGDFREGYMIRRVGGVSILANPYSRQDYGEIEYTAFADADGTVRNRSAYKILRNNT